MAFGAKFPGRCTAGDAIQPGDRIESSGRGYRHVACRAPGGRVGRPLATPVALEPDGEDWMERQARSRDEAEYQMGLADGRRYQTDKAVYGQALADKWQAQEEFDRYWKYGEDY